MHATNRTKVVITQNNTSCEWNYKKVCVFNFLGITQTDGNLERLVRSVGLARSLDWVLTGRQIKAKEAFDAGIVSRLVACGSSMLYYFNFLKQFILFLPLR